VKAAKVQNAAARSIQARVRGSVARQQVKEMKEEIKPDSAPGAGTTGVSRAFRADVPRAPREEPELAPSLSLIEAVFEQLDLNENNVISQREMLNFIRYLDYPGSAADWTKEFEALCEHHGWDPEGGVDFAGFVKLLDDADDNYFVEADQLENVLNELELQAPLVALGASALSAVNERVPPGHDDTPRMSDMQTNEAMNVPIHVTCKGLNFKRLLDIEGLSADFQDAIMEELAAIVGLSMDITQSSLSKESMTVDVLFCNLPMEKAREVIRDLDVAGADLQAMVTEAVRNVPKLRQAANGGKDKIEVDNIVVGDPVPFVKRSRHSLVDQGLAANAVNSMRDFLQAARSRDVSPDSAGEGRFDLSAAGSDIEGGYEQGSKSPAPSRRALTNARVSTSKGNWPGSRRVERRTHLEEFKVLLLKRSPSLSGAWRTIIDRHWQGRITLYDFTQACVEIGYSKKLKVWRELDVDHAGSVTLSELDWEGAETLGKFYALLNQLYGSCKAAAKKWNLTGPRRFHMDEFMQLLVPKGIMNEKDAEFLFVMLAAMPCGSGWNKAAPAVTLREIQWLSKMGPTLPRPAFDRVSPGMLGKTNITPSTGTPGVGFGSPGTLGFASPGTLGPGSPGTMGAGTPGTMFATPRSTSNWDESGYPSDEETGEDEETYSESNTDNNVFMKLYTEAMEHHERKAKLREELQYNHERENPYLQRKVNPKLFERLYKDHEEMAGRKQAAVQAKMDQMAQDANQSDKKVSSPEVQERLYASRQNWQAAAATPGSETSRKHVDNMTIQELLAHGTERAEKLKEMGKDTGWSSWGKSREEIMIFLKDNPLPNPDGSATKKKPTTPAVVQELFDHAKTKKEALEEKIEAAEKDMIEKEKATWACAEHKGNPHKKCSICRRWAAIQAGEPADQATGRSGDLDGKAWVRLHDQGKDHHNTRYENQASIFNELLVQSDRMGLLHEKNLMNAKISLLAVFKNDPRWTAVQGSRRDKLIEDALAAFTAKRQECLEKGQIYGQRSTANPETFFRLYLDGATNDGARMARVRQKVEEEQRLLSATSVHVNTERDPGVFHRLHDGAPRKEKERQTKKRNAIGELTPDITKQLALDDQSRNQKVRRQMLLFSFTDAPWPPPQHFESEFRFALEHIGASNVHQLGVRLKQGNPDGGGIIIEVRGEEKVLKSFHSLPLDALTVSGAPVVEVWSQEAQEDPVGDFVDWICERFNSLEDAWRHFDVDRSGTVSRGNFIQVCKAKQFKSDISFVWHALDNGRSLLDFQDWMTLQPYVAHKASLSQRAHSLHALHYTGDRKPQPIVEFAIALATQFEDIDAAYDHFDTGGYGILSFAEFQAGARSVGWNYDCRNIFQQIDTNKKRQIGRKEFQTLHEALLKEQAIHNQMAGHSAEGYQSYDWQKSSHQKISRKGGKALGKAGGKGGKQGRNRKSPTALQMDEEDEAVADPRSSRTSGKGASPRVSQAMAKGDNGPEPGKGKGKGGGSERRYTTDINDKGKGGQRTSRFQGGGQVPKLPLGQGDEVVVFQLAKDPFLNGEAVRLLRPNATQDAWECHILTGKHAGTKQFISEDNLADLEAVQYAGTEFVSRAAEARLFNDQSAPREGAWAKKDLSMAPGQPPHQPRQGGDAEPRPSRKSFSRASEAEEAGYMEAGSASPPRRKSLLAEARKSMDHLASAQRLDNPVGPMALGVFKESSIRSAVGRGPEGQAMHNANKAVVGLGKPNASKAPQDVKQTILEQQWQKKPSQARASLVASLQGK